jgi:hypothetical protein
MEQINSPVCEVWHSQGVSKIYNPEPSEYETGPVKHNTTLGPYPVFLVSILISYSLLRLCPQSRLHFEVLQ